MTTTCKVLTVRQPHASLIMAGVKTCENRSWAISFRGTLVIHAGMGTDRSEWSEVLDEMPQGALLGTVEVVDCVQDSTSEWAEAGSWHWVLANPRPFATPVPMKGKLGLWNVELADELVAA